jgi:hypothetical protein
MVLSGIYDGVVVRMRDQEPSYNYMIAEMIDCFSATSGIVSLGLWCGIWYFTWLGPRSGSRLVSVSSSCV